jgi:hypothetical protein
MLTAEKGGRQRHAVGCAMGIRAEIRDIASVRGDVGLRLAVVGLVEKFNNSVRDPTTRLDQSSNTRRAPTFAASWTVSGCLLRGKHRYGVHDGIPCEIQKLGPKYPFYHLWPSLNAATLPQANKTCLRLSGGMPWIQG